MLCVSFLDLDVANKVPISRWKGVWLGDCSVPTE